MKDNIFKVISAGGTGTGFFIHDKNLVVTNYHVVQGNREVALQDQRKNRTLAKVVFVNPEVDLAFLKADLPHVDEQKIILNPAMTVQQTQKIYIHGYPFGLPYTVTEGIVSSPRQLLNERYYIQTDAAVNPGNSGGPMLSDKGELLAITTSKFTEADNVGFGILLNDLIKELNDFNVIDDNYNVKCHSCDAIISHETEFCNNCGNTINKDVYKVVELSPFAQFIEGALNELGMNPVLARAGRDNWEFHQNSALIRVFIYKGDYMIATSPLNKLPKQNLNELYQYILSKPASPYILGVYNNIIYISYRMHMSDIFSDNAGEIKKNISGLALKADELDNFFVDNYACEMSPESKEFE